MNRETFRITSPLCTLFGDFSTYLKGNLKQLSNSLDASYSGENVEEVAHTGALNA